MRSGRYQVQYSEMLQKKGRKNGWELSPGVLFHVKGCECTTRWDQWVLKCIETSVSLVGIRAATILYAVPSTARLCSTSELLQMLNNRVTYLSNLMCGKNPIDTGEAVP